MSIKDEASIMRLTPEEQKAFAEASTPLIKWIAENCPPHCQAYVDSGSAELTEGIVNHTDQSFIRD